MKHCNICGKDGEGNFCGICGAPYDDQSSGEPYTQNNSDPYTQSNINQGPPPPPQGYQPSPFQMSQKNNKILPIVLGVVGGVLVLVIIGIIAIYSLFQVFYNDIYYDDYYYEDAYGDYYDDGYYYEDGSWFISNSVGNYDTELGSGNYVVGIDIPVGIYDMTIVSGVGEVYSTFSTDYYDYAYDFEIWYEYDTTSDAYNDEILYVMLPEGTVLTISGLKIQLTSDQAEIHNQEERSNSLQLEVSLQPGKYVAGVDFAVGTYNIVAVEGDGYVSSDSRYAEGYVYNYFSAQSEFYINEYKNVYLEDGDTITTDLSIKLVPST